MANAGQQPLPVSKLPAITAAQISDDDLLLVTDIDGGSKTSRKMTMQQIQTYISARTLSSSAFKTKVQNIAKVQHLFDTRANWEKEPMRSLVLEKSQIAFVNDVSLAEVMMKVGDGSTPFYALPYVRFPADDPAETAIDTRAGWAAKPKFCPAKGQIVIWSDKAQIHKYVLEGGELVDAGLVDVPGIKIGDGNAFNIDLPFVADDIDQKIQQHIDDVKAHVSEQDRKSWQHKITIGDLDTPSDDGVEGETLIITRN